MTDEMRAPVEPTILADTRVQSAIRIVKRERRVLQLRAEGQSWQQIADSLTREGYGTITRAMVAKIARQA